MSSEVITLEQIMEAIMEFPMEEDETPTSEEDEWDEEQMRNDDMTVREMYYHIMNCAQKLCSSNTIICPKCMTAGHFSFQCSYTYYEF